MVIWPVRFIGNIDGKAVSHTVSKVIKGGTIDAGAGLMIGGPANAKLQHRGKVDDIAIWERALSPAEIKKLFTAGKALGDLLSREDYR